MERTQTTPPTEPLKVCTVNLTLTTEQTLHRLSQDASDALGWTVSKSALLRALLTHAEQQTPAWVSSTIHPLIEQEIARGRVWGSKKKST